MSGRGEGEQEREGEGVEPEGEPSASDSEVEDLLLRFAANLSLGSSASSAAPQPSTAHVPLPSTASSAGVAAPGQPVAAASPPGFGDLGGATQEACLQRATAAGAAALRKIRGLDHCVPCTPASPAPRRGGPRFYVVLRGKPSGPYAGLRGYTCDWAVAQWLVCEAGRLHPNAVFHRWDFWEEAIAYWQAGTVSAPAHPPLLDSLLP